MNESKHINYSILAFISLIVLFRIGYAEIQPWDEGLFAMRAKAVLQYGEVIDQTPHAIGGLYSSTYPPLSVWAIASFIKLFGQSALSVRFFSALCSIISVFVLYHIARRLMNEEKAMIVSVLLAGTTVWNSYARQGMTDVPLVMFILSSLIALIKFSEAENNTNQWKWILLFALFFGLGLMTKIVVSFIPLLFALIYFIYSGKRVRILMIFSVLAGILLALPWHIYMAAQHGWEFSRAFLAPHLYQGVENNTSYLGFSYYINQMIIANPFLLLTFVFIFLAIFRFRKIRRNLEARETALFMLLMLWFVSGFIVFSLSPTKMAHYMLYILPPAVILAVKFYVMKDAIIASKKELWTVTCLLLICALWSFGWIIRQDMKLIVSDFVFTSYSSIFLIVLLGSIATIIIFKEEVLNLFVRGTLSKMALVFLFFLILRVAMSNSFVNPGEVNGAVKTSWIIEDTDDKAFVYIYHEHNASDSLNPQLAWYLRGWTCGWRKGKSMINIPMPEKMINLKSIIELDDFPDFLVIYYLPQNKYMAETGARFILETRPLLEQSGRYLVFGKKRHERKKGLEI